MEEAEQEDMVSQTIIKMETERIQENNPGNPDNVIKQTVSIRRTAKWVRSGEAFRG